MNEKQSQVKDTKNKNQSKFIVTRLTECITSVEGNVPDRKISIYQALLDKHFDKKPILVFEEKGESFVIFEK